MNLVVSGITSSTLATAMTTALPNLVEYFGVSTSIGQWVTSVLNVIRNISIGSAVFVGIMTAVSTASAAAYGNHALMHGMNMAFFWMAAGALVLLLIAILGLRSSEK